MTNMFEQISSCFNKPEVRVAIGNLMDLDVYKRSVNLHGPVVLHCHVEYAELFVQKSAALLLWVWLKTQSERLIVTLCIREVSDSSLCPLIRAFCYFPKLLHI
jgi:hypothetical protein